MRQQMTKDIFADDNGEMMKKKLTAEAHKRTPCI